MSSIIIHPLPCIQFSLRSALTTLGTFSILFCLHYYLTSFLNNRSIEPDQMATTFLATTLVLLFLVLPAIFAINFIHQHRAITIHPDRTFTVGHQHPVPITGILLQEKFFGVTVELKTSKKSLQIGRFRSLDEARSFADTIRSLIR